MMTCRDDLVQLYVDGDLHPAEAAIVEAHLATCEACRRRAVVYRGLFWDLSRAERLTSAPDLDADALAAALRDEWVRGQEPSPVRTADLATLWLTANPAVTGPARLAGQGLASLGRRLLGRSSLAKRLLARGALGKRMLGGKGGDER